MKLLTLLLFCLGTFAGHVQAQQITCNLNTFWAINDVGEIKQFELTDNKVTEQGIILSGAPGYSLAFCNNINLKTEQQTFYTSNKEHTYYYSNGLWEPAEGTDSMYLPNADGTGNALFFLDNQTPGAPLFIYDGKKADTIFAHSKLGWGVADIAVDMDGNAWCFLGTPSIDSIFVISPKGKVIKKFGFQMESENAYGTMWLNGTLYIGLGSKHPNSPNTLVPVVISGDVATAGTAISMPSDNYHDLASAKQEVAATVTSAPELITKPNSVSLYPNPASGFINFNSTAAATFIIYNSSGQQVYNSNDLLTHVSVDVSSFASGLYLMQVNTSGSLQVKKFIVQN